MTDFNDEPIQSPDQDQFGLDPFAIAISDCIRLLAMPIGSVVAIHGSWGSGKSSVINLVRHRLRESAPDLQVINFQCWIYRTEDALAVGFFQELCAGLAPVLSQSKKAKNALTKLGVHVAGAGNLLGAILGATTTPLAGKLFESATGVLRRYIQTDETAEALQDVVAEALEDQDQRFLVIVDDLDRLSSEEALVVFRLIKSVGRLPNVIYLLAYDRDVMERAVRARYPSEGVHYLEKIVQAGFELPEPDAIQLNSILLTNIDEIFSDVEPPDTVHFGNLFHEVVAAEISSPRDVIRLCNALSVTWRAVSGEVDLPDFIALEALRIFRPNLYRAIRSNKELLVGAARDGLSSRQQDEAEKHETLLLGAEPERDRERLRRVLMRLFPRLQAVWANTHHTDSGTWARQRRACSEEHFDTFFRYSLSSQTVPRAEILEIIRRAPDGDFIARCFTDALHETQGQNRTKASYLLDELIRHCDNFSDQDVGPFLVSLFRIADALQNPADEQQGFIIGNNNLRIHWLVRALTMDRFTLEERSRALADACQTASLGWLVDISESAYRDYHPTRDEPPEPPERCLLTEADTASVRELALRRVRAAAEDGSIFDADNLASVLFRWRDMASDNGAEVQHWTTAAMNDDTALARLACAFLGKSYSHGMGFSGLGDLVSRQNDRAEVEKYRQHPRSSKVQIETHGSCHFGRSF